MSHLQMLYSEWLDQDLVRIQNKSPPIIFSLATLGFGGKVVSTVMSGILFACFPTVDYVTQM